MNTTQPLNNMQNKVPTMTQPANSTQNMTQPANSTQTIRTLTHSLDVTVHRLGPVLHHEFASGGPDIANAVVVASDRFRFIKSFWTSSDVSATPIGDNPCPGNGAGSISSTTTSLPTNFPTITTQSSVSTSPLNIEVDRDEGYATLAVILQYEGVIRLAGISAALRLPSGFAAQLPLESDKNNYRIALSNDAAEIKPGDSVGLCFPLNVLPNAVVQLPVLGPLALHFLRFDVRAIHDSIRTLEDANFDRHLTLSQGGNDTNIVAHTGNGVELRDPNGMFNVFNRVIPFDYINQVIPVIWKVTGREILDVNLPPDSPGAATSLQCPLSAVVKATSSPCVIPVNIVFNNLGDVGIHNLLATFATNYTSASGQAVTTTTYPLGIINHAVYHVFSIHAGSSFTKTLYVRTALRCSAVQQLSVSSTYTDIIGQKVTQVNTVTLQIQRARNITSGQCEKAAPESPAGPPSAGSNGAFQGQGQGGGMVGPGPTNSTRTVPGPQGQGGSALGPGSINSTTTVPSPQGQGPGPVNSTTIVPGSQGQGGGML